MIRRHFRKLRDDERGFSTIEYGMLAGIVSLGLLGAVMTVGDGLGSSLKELQSTMSKFTVIVIDDEQQQTHKRK